MSKPKWDRPAVHCPTCGREFPKLGRQPINADLKLEWNDMIYIERRLLAGLGLWHFKGNAYETWTPIQAVNISNMRYRQVHNAIRRLVPTGWVKRLDGGRGKYRLTEQAVALFEELITSPNMTIKRLQDTAQEP